MVKQQNDQTIRQYKH